MARYMSPKRRSRMAAPVEEVVEESVETAPEAEDKEQISAFVPASFFKGKTPKEGDTETVRIVSVDPETNEVEMVCVYNGEDKSMESDFDDAMPA